LSVCGSRLSSTPDTNSTRRPPKSPTPELSFWQKSEILPEGRGSTSQSGKLYKALTNYVQEFGKPHVGPFEVPDGWTLLFDEQADCRGRVLFVWLVSNNHCDDIDDIAYAVLWDLFPSIGCCHAETVHTKSVWVRYLATTGYLGHFPLSLACPDPFAFIVVSSRPSGAIIVIPRMPSPSCRHCMS
jgi:hypothetical protein